MTDPNYLRKHFGRLSDDGLLAVDRTDLTELARPIYDEELERRGLTTQAAKAAIPATTMRSVNPRQRDLKPSALVACVTTFFGFSIPIRSFTAQILTLESTIGQLSTIATLVALYAIAMSWLLFYFALYRYEGSLFVTRNMGRLAMGAAVGEGVLIVADVASWIGSFRRQSVVDSTSWPWEMGDTYKLLGVATNLAAILLLIALFRLSRDRLKSDVPVSKLLHVATWMTVTIGAITVVGCLVGLATTPWVYSLVRERSMQLGNSGEPSVFWRLLVDRFRTTLEMICLFSAPFIVWRGSRMRGTVG